MKYKVLWIDDVPNEEFIIEAESYNLEIEQCLCYNDGIAWLRKNRKYCSAVILDVNCKVTKDSNEAPNTDAYTNGHIPVIQLCSDGVQIPWFVYTAGDYDGVSSLNFSIPNNYWLSERKYFNKPADRKELLESIRNNVYDSDFRQIKYEDYKDIFSAFKEHSKQMERLLKLIYQGIHKNQNTDASLLNEARKLLEWMVVYMREQGLLPEYVSTLSNACYFLAKVSEKDYNLVPKYISYGFSMCADATQNGSHNSNNDTTDSNLIVDSLVTQGEVPYLIKSIVFELLNLLSWLKTLPTNPQKIDALSKKIKTFEIKDKNKPSDA